MKKISLLIVYFISFMFMEMIYKLVIFKSFFSITLINMVLFLISISLILFVLTKLCQEKYNKIIYIIIMSLISLWFSAQYVVKSYFDFEISLSTFQVADQINSFFLKVVLEVIKRIPIIILFFIPLIFGIIFRNKIDFEKNNLKKNGIFITLFVLSIFGYKMGLLINKKADYSAYELNYRINNISLSMKDLGVLNTFIIDLKRNMFGFEEKIVLDTSVLEKEERNKEYKFNILDIDFNKLLAEEKNSEIKQIHEYMSKDSGTQKNEYTDMFKDKNLILLMAESFNEIAVDKKLTPTLYKLVNSGFVFKNFYTPTIYSTIGGEFQELTGLYAESSSILFEFRSGEIAFPQGIANKFKEINYNTYAYHNNSYVFQDRNKYLKSLGFDNFKACYNGLEKLINCKKWPQSDVEMIENTVNDFIDKDKFMVFYATVSGHATYSWGNASSKKHKEEYMSAGYDYSTAPASYIAAQMELDKALELLINKLDESGKLEDTVIALVGDHYPYELTIDEINEISTYKKDDIVEVNRSNFILWNSEMDKIEIEKVGSQIDVIPTIYNLFGIDYDSRLFIGKDVLSKEGGLAIFGNRSWVSDKGTYFAHNRKFVPKKESDIPDDYVKTMNQIVNNKIIMSRLIIENNYYQKIFNN